MAAEWQKLAENKRERQQAEIEATGWALTSILSADVLDVRWFPESTQCNLFTPREIGITNTTDIDLLLSNLASARWSAYEVTLAFCKRAIVAHQLVNCLTEIFVKEALARAQELDDYLAVNGVPIGPLHGLPISLKDQICVSGYESTMGYASWVSKFCKRDAVLTQILKACGAIPFVMTNVPQTLLWSETYNLVFGRTLNPANRTLTSGGSSGGEGALLGMNGSPLGVGSDLGGSIRYPSSFNALYGFRTSAQRIPYAGTKNSLDGQDSAPSTLGPMCGSLSGVKVFLKAVIGSEPWRLDPLCIKKKWDEDAYQLAEHGNGEKLCFAFIEHDRSVLPHPPIQRALWMVRDSLTSAGHTVIRWPDAGVALHQDLHNTLSQTWMAGALDDINAVLKTTGEPRLTTMAPEGTTGADTGVYYTNTIPAYKLWQLHKLRRTLRERYLKLWQSTIIPETGRPVDAIIAPVAPFAAPPHGKATISPYTMVWSALNFSCCAFPVTSVDPQRDPVYTRKDSEFMSTADEANWKLYDPETFQNAPVGLQLVGQTLEDEAVLAMTEIVDAALKHFHPR